MIGGLALAGTTADITDQAPSPKPVARVPPGSSLAPHSALVPATGTQELQQGGLLGYGGSSAGLGGSSNELGAEDSVNTSVVRGDSLSRQGDLGSATEQPGSAPASHSPAALGQMPSAPAAGPASEALGEGTGTSSSCSSSTAASAADSFSGLPSSNPHAPVTCSNDTARLHSSDAAAANPAQPNILGRAAFEQGSQGIPVGPSSIAAYRPAGGAAGPGVGVGGGSGLGVVGDEEGQGGAVPAGLRSGVSSQRQSSVGGDSHDLGDGSWMGQRQPDLSGKPTQVRVRFLQTHAGLSTCAPPRMLLFFPVIPVSFLDTSHQHHPTRDSLVKHLVIVCILRTA